MSKTFTVSELKQLRGIDMGSRNDRLAAVGDYRFLIALSVLVLNDRWWKFSYPSWLTGKLSDVAGLVVLPVVVVVVARLVDGRRSSWGLQSEPRWLRAAVFGIVAVWFSAIKTMVWAASSTETLAELVTRRSSAIVVDPTDLIGLIGLVLAWRIVQQPRPLRFTRTGVRMALLGVAGVACMATSEPAPYASTDLGIGESGEVVSIGSYDGSVAGADGPPVVVSGGGQETSACVGDVCVRLNGNVIEESKQDEPFRPVWAFDAGAAPSLSELDVGHIESHRGILDVVAGPDGRIYALLGGDGPIVRDQSGVWTPSFESFRPIAAQLWSFVFFAIATLMTLGSGLKSVFERVGLVCCGVGGALVLLFVLSLPASGVGGLVIFLAAIALMILAAGTAAASIFAVMTGLPSQRIKWLVLGPMAVILTMRWAGGAANVPAEVAPLVPFGLLLAMVVLLLFRWRSEMSVPSDDAIRRAVLAVVASLTVFGVMCAPQLWWQRAVTARFSIAMALSVIIGIAGLVGAFLLRRHASAGSVQDTVEPSLESA